MYIHIYSWFGLRKIGTIVINEVIGCSDKNKIEKKRKKKKGMGGDEGMENKEEKEGELGERKITVEIQ